MATIRSFARSDRLSSLASLNPKRLARCDADKNVVELLVDRAQPPHLCFSRVGGTLLGAFGRREALERSPALAAEEEAVATRVAAGHPCERRAAAKAASAPRLPVAEHACTA